MIEIEKQIIEILNKNQKNPNLIKLLEEYKQINNKKANQYHYIALKKGLFSKVKFCEKVLSLDIKKTDFAIIGSAVMAIRGIKENEDLDISVNEKCWNELNKSYNKTNNGFIKIDNIEIGLGWRGIFEKEIPENEIEILDNLPYIKLKHVLKWKKLQKREKDLKDIELIEKYLSKWEK